VDEGVYYAAVWTDVLDSTPEDRRKFVSRDQLINKANGKPRTWQVLRLARIEHAEVIAPVKHVDIPDMPVSELRKWSFDNGTPAVFITDQPDLPFIKSMPGATVEPCSPGESAYHRVVRFLVRRLLHRPCASHHRGRTRDPAHDDRRPCAARAQPRHT